MLKYDCLLISKYDDSIKINIVNEYIRSSSFEASPLRAVAPSFNKVILYHFASLRSPYLMFFYSHQTSKIFMFDNLNILHKFIKIDFIKNRFYKLV